jgi:hypothetical protein
MDISNFEQFTKTGTKLSNNTISINKSNSFGFNSGFYHKNNIKNYEFVVLFYAKNDNSVAFLFTNDQTVKGKFQITHSKNRTSGGVTCRSFFSNYELNSSLLAGKYEPSEENHPTFGKMFIVKLDEKK